MPSEKYESKRQYPHVLRVAAEGSIKNMGPTWNPLHRESRKNRLGRMHVIGLAILRVLNIARFFAASIRGVSIMPPTLRSKYTVQYCTAVSPSVTTVPQEQPGWHSFDDTDYQRITVTEPYAERSPSFAEPLLLQAINIFGTHTTMRRARPQTALRIGHLPGGGSL